MIIDRMRGHLLVLGACVAFAAACGPGDDPVEDETTPCTRRQDCTVEGERCGDEGVCVEGEQECVGERDCNSGEYCRAGSGGDPGTCEDYLCDEDVDCGAGSICQEIGGVNQCTIGCREDAQCGDASLICQLGQCVDAACTVGDCLDYERCEQSLTPATCVPDGTCANDGNCASYGAFLGDGKAYVCESSQCIERPPCDPAADPDNPDSQCRFVEGEICDAGTCRDGCRANKDCPLDEICNPQSFVCERTCLVASDCEAVVGRPGNYECTPNPDPDVATNICVETCITEDSCEILGQICRSNGVDEPRLCQGCRRNDQCPGDQVCNFELGSNPDEVASDSIGLCEAAPPLCPPDNYGNNHSPVTTQDGGVTLTPYVIQEAFPVTIDGRGDIETSNGPFFCDENVQGEWYQIDGVSPGQVISAKIEYETGGANLDVALYNQNQVQLVAATRPPGVEGGVDELRWGTPAGGTFLIQVRGTIVDPRIAYALTIDVADPAPCVDDVFEENDAEATAKPLPKDVEHSGLQVCSALGSAGTTDRDFYTLDVAANQVVELAAQAERRLGDVDLFVVGPDGTPFAAETIGDSERLEFLSTDAGLYTVEVVVRGGIGNVDYIIEWDEVDNDCFDPFEVGPDNNDICSASSLVTEQVYSDLRLCTDGDFYQIDLLPEEKLTARACYDPRQSAGFVDLRLRGPEQAQCAVILEYDTRVEGDDPDVICQQVVFEADRGGSYFLAATLNQGVNVQYDLDIDIEEGPPCIEDRFEAGAGNDTFADAVALDPSDQADLALPGLQFCDTNEDFFAVDLTAGQEVRWEVLHKVNVGDLDAEILAPDGSAVAAGTTDTDDEIVSYTAPADGRYTIRVYGKFPDRVGYQLHMYVDGVGPADPICPDVFENNDVRADAVELSEGSYNLLVCGTPDDKDWFRTLLEPGETIEITTTFNPSAGNVDVRLFRDGPTGSELVSTTGAMSPKVLSYTATQQQYVVYQVNTYTGVESNSYQLDVNIQDAPPCVDDSSEDNDTGATASVVDAPGLYSRLAKCEADADWYRFDVLEGAEAEAYINFDGDRADLDIIVYSDAAGTAEVGRSEGTGSGESVTFTASTDANPVTTTATYWVQVVSKVPARGNYDLMLYQDTDGDGTPEGPEDRVCPDRYEQNDTRATPAELGVGTFNDLLMCWGAGTNDDDYYSVFVPGNATLTADLTFAHDSGDIQARLYKRDPTTLVLQLVASGTSSDDNETVSFANGPQGADYVLQVFSSAIPRFKNYYDLSFSLAFADACSEDAESARDAGSVVAPTVPDSYGGLILCENTEDWFEVTAGVGDEIFAAIELNKRFGDLDLELQDSLGNTLVVNEGEDNIEELTYVATVAGSYFLRVYPKNGAFVRNEYDLYLRSGATVPIAPYCPDSYERNDSLEQAASLNFSTQKLFEDPIACGADEDWYQINLASGQTYQFSAMFDHTVNSDVDLELFDDQGASLQASSTQDNDEYFSYQATQNGIYYLKASNVAATPLEAPYSLYLNTPNGPCTDDSYEPNNSFGSAFQNILPDEGTYALSNCYKGSADSTPEDYFSYTAKTAGDIKVTLANEENIVGLQLFVDFQPASPAGNNRQDYTKTGVSIGDRITVYVFNTGTTSGPYFITIEED